MRKDSVFKRECLLAEIEGKYRSEYNDTESHFIRHIETSLQNIKKPLLHDTLSEEAESSFAEAIKFLDASASTDNTTRLFRLRAFADALVHKKSDWLEFLSENLNTHNIQNIMALTIEEALQYSWTFIPCLFVSRNNSFVRFLLCGILKGGRQEVIIPEWGKNIMDNDFSESIRDVYDCFVKPENRSSPMSSSFSMCCVPVAMASDAPTPLFNGNSAGLSLWLGTRYLLDNEPYPMNIAATGRVKAGKIENVGFIQEKKKCAQKNCFEFFFYPLSIKNINNVHQDHHLNPYQHHDSHNTACFQVRDIEEAYRLSFQCITGLDPRLHHIISSPEIFASSLASVTESGLLLIKNYISEYADKICLSSDLFSRFLHSFRSLVKSSENRKAALISSCFNERIEKSEIIDRISKLEWFCLNHEIANHSGMTDISCRYSEKAKKIVNEAKKTKECRELRKWLFNYEFINRRHNHFIFHPEIPDDFQELIRKAEKILEIESEEIEGACDPALASIYGTIAQNFAFCGPEYLDKTLSFAEKAVKTFGGIEDGLRQYNYTTYAFLDAEDFGSAEKHFLIYSGKDSVESVLDDLDSLTEWKHALFIRFIADTDNFKLFENYLELCRSRNFSFVSDEHPWQLWYYNMARCAAASGMHDLSERMCHKSIEICSSENSGDTIKTMSLLPLSLLHEKRHSTESIKKCAARARDIAVSLNPCHFRDIENSRPDEILQVIAEQKYKLFPFSYR